KDLRRTGAMGNENEPLHLLVIGGHEKERMVMDACVRSYLTHSAARARIDNAGVFAGKYPTLGHRSSPAPEERPPAPAFAGISVPKLKAGSIQLSVRKATAVPAPISHSIDPVGVTMAARLQAISSSRSPQASGRVK